MADAAFAPSEAMAFDKPFSGQPLRRQTSSSYLQEPPVWSDLALLSDESRENIEKEWHCRDKPLKASRRRCLPVPQLTITLLRRTCYLLHVLLVVIHIVLLGLAISHVEHRVIFTITPKSTVLATVLSISLQAFYTVYTAAMVFVTQRVALSRALSQRQKLTAIHDTSGAWTGLGSALCCIWQQTNLAASTWRTLVIAAYLTCISMLHITSSSIIELQTFNNTISSTVPTTVGWPASSDLVNVQWSFVSTLVPFINRFYAASSPGLSNNTVYDVVSVINGTGTAIVNATTISATCGLIPTVNLTYGTVVQQLPTGFLYGTPWPDNGSLGGDSPNHLGVPWKNQVTFPAFLNLNNWSDIVFVVSASIDTNSLSNAEVALPVTWPYMEPGNNNTLQADLSIYLVGCSITTLRQNATIDARTNELLELPPPPERTSKQWTKLEEPPSTPQASVTGVTDWVVGPFEFASAFNSSFMNAYLEQTPGDTPSELDVIMMQSLSFNETVYSANHGGDVPNVNPEPIPLVSIGDAGDFEDALTSVLASSIWAAGQLGVGGGGGFPRSLGEAVMSQQVLEWRLHLSVALAASLIGLVLVVQMIGLAGRRSQQEPVVKSAGVLEFIWLAVRMPTLKQGMEGLEDPTAENLRPAGMFDVCFGEDLDEVKYVCVD
ncbi:hypothetical protein BV22DRAFT_1065752 [Leucogyrophana mollusca]|uniref:Uncharacterized protein n=1 Tax=Leucogyrophana mollusca TaxID=85980 RepID=A0ACB8BKD4_9AGAM|nr:hypothetical protein BV22DRAFT_1065752 [Leucogyrophana mollusca]